MLLAFYAITVAFMERLGYSGTSLLVTLSILLLVGATVNIVLAKLFKAAINAESSYITVFILFFLVPPVDSVQSGFMAAGVAILAMASKFIVAYRRKHLFNPAAFAVAVFYFFGYGAFWWIGTPILFIPTLILGLLIVRKIRRFSLFFSFLATAIPVMLAFSVFYKFEFFDSLMQLFLSWPLIFFGTVMLTEPLTTPPTRKLQMIYGALVGALFSYQLPIFSLYPSPELALLVGNVFSFIVSPKEKLILTLKGKKEIAEDTYEFVFESPRKIGFRAGQYLEWTLNQFITDGRGNRRYFTLASSPQEEGIKIGVKMNTPSSSFKKGLKELKVGEKLMAGQLAGDFTIPNDENGKFVFIAGGIGVTPFRSIIADLIDKKDTRSFVLFYANKTVKEIAYKDFFDTAQNTINLKTFYSISDETDANWKGLKGRLTPEVLQKNVADYKERTYYLSGPELMVEGYKKLLLALGVRRTQIRTDYFPGF